MVMGVTFIIFHCLLPLVKLKMENFQFLIWFNKYQSLLQHVMLPHMVGDIPNTLCYISLEKIFALCLLFVVFGSVLCLNCMNICPYCEVKWKQVCRLFLLYAPQVSFMLFHLIRVEYGNVNRNCLFPC